MSATPASNFVIRNLTPEDIPELIELPRAEGREMGQEPEISTWLAADPDGIFVAVDAADGTIAGCCSGIALSDTHGYIGMYVVKSKYRGVGVGRVLWNSAIDRLGDRNISLSSADKMWKFYHGKGFGVAASWTVDLYAADEPILPGIVFSRPMPFPIAVDPRGPFVQNVIDYDFNLHRYDRSVAVRATVDEPGTLTLMTVRPTVAGQRLVTTGYACMKKGLQGRWLIAPLYADDFNSARSLLHGLIGFLSDDQRQEGVVAKLVSSNTEASKLFHQFGLKRTEYRLRRLFTKDVFDIPEKKVFALQTSVFCTE